MNIWSFHVNIYYLSATLSNRVSESTVVLSILGLLWSFSIKPVHIEISNFHFHIPFNLTSTNAKVRNMLKTNDIEKKSVKFVTGSSISDAIFTFTHSGMALAFVIITSQRNGLRA